MEKGATMTADLSDERDLPELLMVWPVEQLPSAPKVTIPQGYMGRGGRCSTASKLLPALHPKSALWRQC